jgi:uncharacterized protein
MSLVRLKVISETPSAASAVFGDSDAGGPRWRWNPDAKLLPARDGAYTLANFAKNRVTTLDERDGKILARVSGMAIPFRVPPGLSEGALDELHKTEAIIAEQQMPAYEEGIRREIATHLEASHGLIIMPTEKCNFRCTYCYETFEKGRMSADDAMAVSRAIARIAESAEHFSLSFFGGEPLMCSDLVVRFSREALAVRARLGASYGASITTNASYLTPDLIDDLLDAGVVNFQITLDGDEENHNRQRRTVKGDPTFQRVVASLRALAKQPKKFECLLRCNVHAANADAVISLFNGEVLESLRGDTRFQVLLEQIWSSDRQSVEVSEETAQSVAACGSGMAQRLDQHHLSRELDARGFKSQRVHRDTRGLAGGCYAGKPNWYVVGSDLTLYKCTVLFDLEENKVGRVNPDGTFAIDEAKSLLWTGSNALTDSGCGACHLRVPCLGVSCPVGRVVRGHKKCHEAKSMDGLLEWSQGRPA